MILMPIVYVSDMDKAVAFYEKLGFLPDPSARSRMWTQLIAGDRAILALHHDDHPGPTSHLRVELALVTTEPLEQVRDRLRKAGIEPNAIVDEAFGRSMTVKDPDGLAIQINEHQS